MTGRRGTTTPGRISLRGRRRSERPGTVSRRGATMSFLSVLLLLPAAGPDDGLAKKMLPIYVKEVESYSLAVESAPRQRLELKKEPVFEWANPDRDAQQGAVFL